MIIFQVGYSSPSESGIEDELGLTLAEVNLTEVLFKYFHYINYIVFTQWSFSFIYTSLMVVQSLNFILTASPSKK